MGLGRAVGRLLPRLDRPDQQRDASATSGLIALAEENPHAVGVAVREMIPVPVMGSD